VIKDSIVIGADYYIPKRNPEVPIGIGRYCQIEAAILDKNVQIGDGVLIKSFANSQDMDHELYSVRDGIVVIAKDTVIPQGTCIEPK
jgi:glucose-1-phosphate adenylyltransferase